MKMRKPISWPIRFLHNDFVIREPTFGLGFKNIGRNQSSWNEKKKKYPSKGTQKSSAEEQHVESSVSTNIDKENFDFTEKNSTTFFWKSKKIFNPE